MFGTQNYNYGYPWNNGIGSQATNYTPQQQGMVSNIVWVQGKEGAKSIQVNPGNSVLLMDSEQQVFYIKTADASGLPQPLRVFPYTEKLDVAKNATTDEKQPEYVTREEFEKRLTEVMNAKPTIPAA